jgi:hypothetical protein
MSTAEVKIKIGFEGQQSVSQVEEKTKSLKAQLKEMKTLLASGTLDSDQFRKLSIEAGQLQDQIADVNQRVKNLASDSRRLDAFLGLAQGITGGFAAAQGVMAAFGAESEDLQKTLLKVQGAMAALNGIQAIANTLNKDSALMTEIAARGWGKLNDSLKAGLIGTVLTAIALVVDQLSKWTAATEEQITAQEELNFALKATDDALNRSIGSHEYYTTLYLDNLKKQGKGQAEINELLERQRKADTDALYQDGQAKARIQEAAYQRMSDARSNFQFDDSEANKKAYEEAQKALEDANAAAEKTAKAYQERIDKNDIERSRDRLALEAEITKKQEDAAKKAEEDRKKREAERLANEASAYKKKRDLALEDAQMERDLIASLENEGKEEEEKRRKQEEFSKAYRLGLTIDQYEQQKEINAQELEQTTKLNEAKAKAEWDLVNAKRAALDAGLNIAQQFAGKNKTLADVLFAVQKGVAIAQIIVDTQKEIAGYASNPTWSLMPDGGASVKIPAIAAAKVRAATSIATIAATSVSRFMNGGNGASVGGGGSATGTGAGSMGGAPNTSRFVPTTTSGGASSQRVYVLEKDITDSQGRVAKIRHNATLI